MHSVKTRGILVRLEDLRRLPYKVFHPTPKYGKLTQKSYSQASICLCNSETFHILPANFSDKSSFPYSISSVSSFMTCGSVILLFVFKCLIFYYHMFQEYTLYSALPGHLFLSMCLVRDRLFLSCV